MTDLTMSGGSVPGRLGVTARMDDGRFRLDLVPQPETMHHGLVRASVLAYVVDAVAGISVDDDREVWTLTTDLSVRSRPVPAPERVSATATVVRRGRRSATLLVELIAPDGALVATGAAGFATIPRKDTDPPKPFVTPELVVDLFGREPTITSPLREEAGVEVLDAAAGVVELAVTSAVRNPNGTLQGAMVALVAEAAVEDMLSARHHRPVAVIDLDIRYLARAERGPVRSACRLVNDDTVEVLLTDTATATITTLVYARTIDC